jgi:VanZ family protein
MQVYVPGRSSNHYDLLASVVGIILVLIFIYGNNYSKKEA